MFQQQKPNRSRRLATGTDSTEAKIELQPDSERMYTIQYKWCTRRSVMPKARAGVPSGTKCARIHVVTAERDSGAITKNSGMYVAAEVGTGRPSNETTAELSAASGRG